MSDPTLYPVSPEWAERALMDKAGYGAARQQAQQAPDTFWAQAATRLDWISAPTVIKNVSFDRADFRIRWFEDGVLNVAWNCIDRHLPTRRDQTAILWEGDDPTDSRAITYGELHGQVCRMANVLKAQGVKKGVHRGMQDLVCDG